MPFARGPVLIYAHRGRYTTMGPSEYVGRDQIITIPAGFGTDLASVPRAFWALLPPTGAYEDAAVLHDFLCTELEAGRPVVAARDADGLFRRVMREAGVGLVTRWVMWAGVRWGAVGTPARRPGWWRDAPLVLLLTGLAVALVVALLAVAHLCIDLVLPLLLRL